MTPTQKNMNFLLNEYQFMFGACQVYAPQGSYFPHDSYTLCPRRASLVGSP